MGAPQETRDVSALPALDELVEMAHDALEASQEYAGGNAPGSQAHALRGIGYGLLALVEVLDARVET